MNRRRADTVVVVLVGFVSIVGGAVSWQAYQQRRSLEESMGSMMDGTMETMHGPDPLWYVLGTLLVVGIIGGLYLLVRTDLTDEADPPQTPMPDAASSETAPAQDDESTGGGHPRQNQIHKRACSICCRTTNAACSNPSLTRPESHRSNFATGLISRRVKSVKQ
nr:MarR family transcriptional regulator [Halorhabdus sp. CBA1104]